jgi:pimeloyl-ACP methyl ester carboxylesterase
MPGDRGAGAPRVPAKRAVVANGLRHHVLEWDGGGATTVLCLHGFLDLGWAFHRVGGALADAGYHVVAPDLRGHGRTERVGPGGYYHFMDYLLDVADLADALARDRLALVGHSMGAGIAAYFAGAFPDRVWRAVMMEGMRVPETAPEELPGRVERWVEGVRRARGRAPTVYPTLDEAAARLRQLDPRCPDDEARFLAEKMTVPLPGGVAFRHDPVHLTRGPYPFRLEVAEAFWMRVRCPVLMLEGADTDLRIADWPARLARFRDVREVVIPGAGHMMMRHRPDEVAQAIVDFLGEPGRR